jgi:hypothetical protein
LAESDGAGQAGFSAGGHKSVASGARGAGAVHAASASAIADNAAYPLRGNNVFWVFLEIAIALGIAVAIVWWTFPRKRGKREAPPADDEGRNP